MSLKVLGIGIEDNILRTRCFEFLLLSGLQLPERPAKIYGQSKLKCQAIFSLIWFLEI
jgi:hypothetical protein